MECSRGGGSTSETLLRLETFEEMRGVERKIERDEHENQCRIALIFFYFQNTVTELAS